MSSQVHEESCCAQRLRKCLMRECFVVENVERGMRRRTWREAAVLCKSKCSRPAATLWNKQSPPPPPTSRLVTAACSERSRRHWFCNSSDTAQRCAVDICGRKCWSRRYLRRCCVNTVVSANATSRGEGCGVCTGTASVMGLFRLNACVEADGGDVC